MSTDFLWSHSSRFPCIPYHPPTDSPSESSQVSSQCFKSHPIPSSYFSWRLMYDSGLAPQVCTSMTEWVWYPCSVLFCPANFHNGMIQQEIMWQDTGPLPLPLPASRTVINKCLLSVNYPVLGIPSQHLPIVLISVSLISETENFHSPLAICMSSFEAPVIIVCHQTSCWFPLLSTGDTVWEKS